MPPRPVLFAPSGARLDEIDLALLQQVQIDARTSTEELSRRVNLSRRGVLWRLQRLESAGAIVRHTAEIDDAMFDVWPTFHVELVLTALGRLARERLEAAIQTIPEVTEAVEIIGDFDMLLRAALPTPAYWPVLQRRMDPEARWVDKVSLRPGGRRIKRASPHPLLAGAPKGDI